MLSLALAQPSCEASYTLQSSWLSSVACLAMIVPFDVVLVGNNMPEKIAIGTRRVFQNNDPFVYDLLRDDNGQLAYVCQKTSSYGREGEVLTIMDCTNDQGERWFVATEGILANGTFTPRQQVFRTQGPFWEPRQHQWQTNRFASRNNFTMEVDWDADWLLVCETRHPSE